MRTITLEEHFVTPGFLQAIGTSGIAAPAFQALQKKLLDLGDGRLTDMDEAGVDLQLLSLAALGLDDLDAAIATPLLCDVNDELAAAIATHPKRFAGLASVAMKDPDAAAQELERCIRTLGFKGLILDGTSDGEFLDQPRFLPVFEAANALKIPIYLHPAPPPPAVKTAYFSGLPADTAYLLSIAGWGWHAETGLHVLRLIVSGLFDRFPDLQIVIGHMGEGIPYALARSSAVLGSTTKHLQRSVAEYFRQNFHVTTSGYFTLPPFQCALEVVGIDRLLYSVDYPFSPNTRGRDFLNALRLSDTDYAKLTQGNAEALFAL